MDCIIITNDYMQIEVIVNIAIKTSLFHCSKQTYAVIIQGNTSSLFHFQTEHSIFTLLWLRDVSLMISCKYLSLSLCFYFIKLM